MSLTENSMVHSGDDWERQLQLIEENEKCEASVVRIPEQLQAEYGRQFLKFGPNQKISVLKLLASFNWAYTRCNDLLKLLMKTPKEKMMLVIDLIEHFKLKEGFLELIMDLLFFLDEKSYVELLDMSRTDIIRAVEMRRYLTREDRMFMCDVINELSVRELFEAVDRCRDPASKHCRLCKIRRLDKLEFGMLHQDTIVGSSSAPSSGSFRVPGAPPVYRAQIWSADDEMFFTFDFEHQHIFFKKELVDLVNICGNCFQEVNRAAASNGKFTELHHLPGETRKEIMRDQRIEEIGAAILFKNISRERLYRRARDFALRAVAAASQGVIAERAEAAREDVKRKEREKVIAHKEERLDLVTRALVTDRKWIRNDIIGQINEIDRKNTISKLMHLPQYGPDNPAPSREFSILTLEDSKKVFNVGRSRPSEILDPNTVLAWQKDANKVFQHSELKRLESIKVQARAKEAQNVQAKETVQLYMYKQSYAKKAAARDAELQEEMRVDSRAADKIERKRLRIEGYEEAEREKMEKEDVLSSATREWEREKEREEIERVSMEHCEHHQTHTSVQEGSLLFDRYWGLDAYRDMLEEARRRQLEAWSSKAEELRKMCVQIKLIQPYSEEVTMARKGKMNITTGKLIR